MKKEELDILLDKYYKGESTDAEEKALIRFFSNGDVPGGYEAEKIIFSFLMRSSEVPEPSTGFEEKILLNIDESVRRSRVMRKLLFYGLSTAAAFLIIFGTWSLLDRESVDTYDDPEIAYTETLRILSDVSVSLNRGSAAFGPFSKMNQAASAGLETIRNSTGAAEKNLKSLGYLRRGFEITDAIDKKANN